MSVENRRFAPESNKDNKDDKKSTKSSKKAAVPLSPLVSFEAKQGEKKAPAPINEALASLLASRPELELNKPPHKKLEKDEKPEPKKEAAKRSDAPEAQEAVVSELVPGEQTDAIVDRPDADREKPKANAEDTDEADAEEKAYEPLPEYEPASNRLNGGEFMIDLNGPVQELVVPLHNEGEPTAPEPVATPESAPTDEREISLETPSSTAEVPLGAEPAPEPDAAAGGGGEVPPEPPFGHSGESGAASDEPEPDPEPAERQPAVSPEPILPRPEDVHTHQVASAERPVIVQGGEQAATKQDVEDALYHTAKQAQNRGLLTGLIVGGAYEHFKHKRREKKQERRFKKQAKQLHEARQDYAYGLQEQERQRGESHRRFAQLETRLRRERQAERQAASSAHRPERLSNISHEQLPAPKVEKLPASQHEKLLPRATPVAEAPAEQLQVPVDHRLETSAWHTIEVDAKTGKPVENPAFQYGHEYYQERAQENTPVHQRNAAAGEVALVAAAASAGLSQPSTQAGQDAGTVPAAIPSASRQGPPVSAKDKAKTAIKSAAQATNASDGPIWPWVVVLLAIILLLIVVLH